MHPKKKYKNWEFCWKKNSKIFKKAVFIIIIRRFWTKTTQKTVGGKWTKTLPQFTIELYSYSSNITGIDKIIFKKGFSLTCLFVCPCYQNIAQCLFSYATFLYLPIYIYILVDVAQYGRFHFINNKVASSSTLYSNY